MSQEIELKLALTPKAAQAFPALLAASGLSVGEPLERHLANTYFDTPDQQLNRHAVALRIRDTGQGWVQTLKTRGQSDGGLHQRQEWEWSLAEAQLDSHLLPLEALPAGVTPDRLQPAFRTDFSRTAWMVREGESEIELVLDRGEAVSGAARAPIFELELELKRGEPDSLYRVALCLARYCPLHLCDVSKAERGYRLHGETPGEPPALATGGSIGEQLSRALACWAWCVDRYSMQGQATVLPSGIEALAQVAGLLPRLPVAEAAWRPVQAAIETWCDGLRQALDRPGAPLAEVLHERAGCAALLQVAAWRLAL